MNISKKLFLSLIGLTSIILLVPLLLARWSFAHGFSDFIRSLEQQRLSRLGDSVSQIYQEAGGNWQAASLLELEQMLNRTNMHGPDVGRERLPRPIDKPKKDYTPGRAANKYGENTEREAERNPKRPPPPPRFVASASIVTVLYGLDDNRIAGPDIEAVQGIGMIVTEYTVMADGEEIARLKSWNTERFGSSLGSEFRSQQIAATIWIGLICLMLAGVLSFYWSKVILNPIQSVMQGIKRLSSGNYKDSIQHQRKDEFGALIDDVNALAHTLEQTKSAKSRWFADISHELRTPLSVLLGEIEAMQAGIRPMNEQNMRSLEQEALLLKRLVDDLFQLSVSDIGALRYEFQAFDISALATRYCESTQASAQRANISFSCHIDEGLIFRGDENRISQLMSNLLNNSVKYTDIGGIIRFSVKKQSKHILILLEDSAPSVSLEVCQFLFEPLYRIEKSRNRNQGGAGLGLAICKNIVSAHKGSISAAPSALGGLRIEVLLPLH
jgi:two-component system sensor histidine kinase BaeS